MSEVFTLSSVQQYQAGLKVSGFPLSRVPLETKGKIDHKKWTVLYTFLIVLLLSKQKRLIEKNKREYEIPNFLGISF